MTTNNKYKIQQQILQGALTMPNIPALRDIATTTEYSAIERMFEALFNTYITAGSRTTKRPVISVPVWAQRVQNSKVHNYALKVLSKANWITVHTRPNNNWSEAYINESKLLTYVTQVQLDKVRMYNKFKHFKLQYHNLSQDFGANKMRIQGKNTTVHHSMTGFAKAGAIPFQFDTTAMSKNQELITTEINKGISKMITKYPAILEDHANYKEVGREIVEALIIEASTYNSGPRTSDPRHRNNAGYLNKIGNPVGFKIMRGLLVIPAELRNTCTPNGLINKYLFIAELVGFKTGTKQDKINFGRHCYYTGTLSKCEVENIWLKRTYNDINVAFDNKYEAVRYNRYLQWQEYSTGNTWHQARAPKLMEDLVSLESNLILNSNHQWVVPIEIDMSASILGYIGLLLNHKPFMDRCNITHGTLSDAWGHSIITNREQFKTIMRQCYGSQMSPNQMWDDMDISYTQNDVDAFNYELQHGELAVANAFKDFIINNAKMQSTMKLRVLNKDVITHCNKFHTVGETTTVYDLYDTTTERIRRIHNTSIKQVPNLKQFRTYTVTGLIHGIDGAVMNNTIDATIDKYNWAIDIHDAVVCCCEAADYTRDIYANGRTADEPSLKHVHTNRNKILSEYFTSINIPASAIKDWKTDVVPHIIPMEEELIINPMVLK